MCTFMCTFKVHIKSARAHVHFKGAHVHFLCSKSNSTSTLLMREQQSLLLDVAQMVTIRMFSFGLI